MSSKPDVDTTSEAIHDAINCVVELHVSNGTDKIQSVIHDEVKTSTDLIVSCVKEATSGQAQEYDKDINRFIESHNTVIDTVNKLTESVLVQNKKNKDRAERSEHISYQVRGQLGSQERKRRKVDLNEITRLKNEVATMKWKNQNKDQMVRELSDRIASVIG